MGKPMSSSAMRREVTVASMPGRKDTDLRYRPYEHGGSILRRVRRTLTVLSAIFAIVLNGQLVQAQDGNKLKIGFSMEAMKGER